MILLIQINNITCGAIFKLSDRNVFYVALEQSTTKINFERFFAGGLSPPPPTL